MKLITGTNRDRDLRALAGLLALGITSVICSVSMAFQTIWWGALSTAMGALIMFSTYRDARKQFDATYRAVQTGKREDS